MKLSDVRLLKQRKSVGRCLRPIQPHEKAYPFLTKDAYHMDVRFTDFSRARRYKQYALSIRQVMSVACRAVLAKICWPINAHQSVFHNHMVVRKEYSMSVVTRR